MGIQAAKDAKSPTRFTFNRASGTLTRYDGELRRSFRADPPQARVRWHRDRSWCVSDGSDVFDFRGLIARSEQYKIERQGGTEPLSRRILSHVVPESIEAKPLLWLRHSLQSEVNRAQLRHLGRINQGVIALTINPFLLSAIAPRLFRDVSGATEFDSNSGRIDRLLLDTVEMLESTGRRNPVFHSLRKLRATHDELAWLYRQERPTVNHQLAQPPFPGIDGILEPLCSNHDLWHEGRGQKNCVAAPHYARRVRAGSHFIYRLLVPQRCTLSIERSGTRWSISELECAQNRRADPATWRWVESWLRNARRLTAQHAEDPRKATPKVAKKKRRKGLVQGELRFE